MVHAKVKIIIGSVFALIIMLSFLLFNQKNMSISPASEFYIQQSELKKFEQEALHGDGAAAFALAQYYGLYVSNHVEEEKWLRISSDNGHLIGKFNYAYILLDKNDVDLAEVKKLAGDIAIHDKANAQLVFNRIKDIEQKR